MADLADRAEWNEERAEKALAEVAQLQAKIARLESAIADHVIASELTDIAELEEALATIARVEALLEREGCDCGTHPDDTPEDGHCFACQVQHALDGKVGS